MFRRRTISRLRSTVRSSLTVTVLAGLLIGTIGFPVAPPGTFGGSFPCEGHGCGCRSVEECWLGCCCLTPAQRLAWAKEHDVTPPPEVVRLAEREKPATRTVATCCSRNVRTTHVAKSSCCSKGVTKQSFASCGRQPAGSVVAGTPEAHASSSPVVSECAKAVRCAKSHEHAVAASDEDESAPVFAPRRCRGTGRWWVAASQPFALPDRPATLAEVTVAEPLRLASTRYALDADSPPTRPG